MPVYHFTFHAYRSWREDHPKGYVQRGKPGVQRPNASLAHHRGQAAAQPAAEFDAQQRRVLRDVLRGIAEHLGCRLHGFAVTPNHVHMVVSWGHDAAERSVAARCKRLMGHKLTKALGVRGRRWFSRGWDAKRVTEQSHLDRLLVEYLPGHRQQHGVVWTEREGTGSR